MKRRTIMLSRALNALLLAAVLAPLAACETFEPTWVAIEDFAILYSLARAEYIGRESGYDLVGQVPVVIERPKSQNPFDFDVAITEIDGVMHILPAGMFEGFQIEPGIRVVTGTTFDELVTAPPDGYVTDQALPLAAGSLFAVRARRDQRGCNMYGKLEILDVRPTGIVEIRTLRNPSCNDRNLVPPR